MLLLSFCFILLLFCFFAFCSIWHLATTTRDTALTHSKSKTAPSTDFCNDVAIWLEKSLIVFVIVSIWFTNTSFVCSILNLLLISVWTCASNVVIWTLNSSIVAFNLSTCNRKSSTNATCSSYKGLGTKSKFGFGIFGFNSTTSTSIALVFQLYVLSHDSP